MQGNRETPAGASTPDLVVDSADQPFWEAIERGEFVLARCNGCGTRSTVCRPCTVCGADGSSFVWEPASGNGRIRTFAVFHRPYHPYFANLVPYNVAIVTLDEGPDLLTNVIGCSNDELAVGTPVHIVTRRRGGRKIHQAEVVG